MMSTCTRKYEGKYQCVCVCVSTHMYECAISSKKIRTQTNLHMVGVGVHCCDAGRSEMESACVPPGCTHHLSISAVPPRLASPPASYQTPHRRALWKWPWTNKKKKKSAFSSAFLGARYGHLSVCIYKVG